MINNNLNKKIDNNMNIYIDKFNNNHKEFTELFYQIITVDDNKLLNLIKLIELIESIQQCISTNDFIYIQNNNDHDSNDDHYNYDDYHSDDDYNSDNDYNDIFDNQSINNNDRQDIPIMTKKRLVIEYLHKLIYKNYTNFSEMKETIENIDIVLNYIDIDSMNIINNIHDNKQYYVKIIYLLLKYITLMIDINAYLFKTNNNDIITKLKQLNLVYSQSINIIKDDNTIDDIIKINKYDNKNSNNSKKKTVSNIIRLNNITKSYFNRDWLFIKDYKNYQNNDFIDDRYNNFADNPENKYKFIKKDDLYLDNNQRALQSKKLDEIQLSLGKQIDELVESKYVGLFDEILPIIEENILGYFNRLLNCNDVNIYTNIQTTLKYQYW